MIKRFARFMAHHMDLDDDKINRVTMRDVVFLLLISPLLYVLMLPLLLLVALMELFEFAFALIIVAAIFASPVSLYLIFIGQSSPTKIVVACVSTFVLIARYVVCPLVKRTERYQQFKVRLFRV